MITQARCDPPVAPRHGDRDFRTYVTPTGTPISWLKTDVV